MASPLTQAVGGLCILLGIAWVIWPIRMANIQYRVLYFWAGKPDDVNQNPTIGRIGGVVLVVLGALLAAGFSL